MSAPGGIPDYHGPHIRPLLADPVKLAWYEPTQLAQHVRVTAHTCHCRATTYELCAAGGQGFIRRMDRERRTVHETARTLTAVARRTFEQILNGEAA